MVDGGVTIIRCRLHGLGEGEERILSSKVAKPFNVFVVDEEQLLDQQGDYERGMLW